MAVATWTVRSMLFWSAGTSGSMLAGTVAAYPRSASATGRARRPRIRWWYVRSNQTLVRAHVPPADPGPPGPPGRARAPWICRDGPGEHRAAGPGAPEQHAPHGPRRDRHRRLRLLHRSLHGGPPLP